MDRTDRKFGGSILVAVPAEEATKFAKKCGTDFEGRNSTPALRGTFVLVDGRWPSGFWMVDTTGRIPKLLADKKFEFPANANKPGDLEGGPGRDRRSFRKPL